MTLKKLDIKEKTQQKKIVSNGEITSDKKLMKILDMDDSVREKLRQKKNFAADILNLKRKVQQQTAMNTSILFQTDSETLINTRKSKIETIDSLIKSSLDLLKKYLKVDYLAYASVLDIHNLYKDSSFNFYYSNGNFPQKVNPRRLEDGLLQAENCFLETGSSLSYFRDSKNQKLLDIIYSLKGHSGNTIGYLLIDGLAKDTIDTMKNIIDIFHRELFHVLMERENLILLQKLEKSELDPLTGLKRRDALINKCREIFERNSRIYIDKNKSDLEKKKIINPTLAILDIDDFKKVNDEYGHLVGDLVIQKIVQVCKQNSRQADKWTWYRYGGEEFVGIFDSIPIEGAILCLNRIQNDDKKIILSDSEEKKEISVTLSIGITTITLKELGFYAYINNLLFKEFKKEDFNLSNKELIKFFLEKLENIQFDLEEDKIVKYININSFYTSVSKSVEEIKNLDTYSKQELIFHIQNIIKDFLINNVINRADNALYSSKNTGKNKITIN